MPPGPLKIKEKSYSTMTLHQTCQLELWNFIRQNCCYVVTATYMPADPEQIRVESCYVAAAATNMPAGQVQLLHTPLLFQHAYWNVAARWMHAGPLPLNQLLPLNSAYPLVLCFSICHTCWCIDSLSVVPAGVVLHYRPCRLAWCLIISHTCWRVASL